MARNLILMLPLVLLTSNVALSQLLVWDRSIEDYLQSMKLGEAVSKQIYLAWIGQCNCRFWDCIHDDLT